MLGGTRTEVVGWRATVGHNWGAEHAERWVWLHAAGFEDEPGAWLELAIARVRVGRMLTPWVANGALALGGRRFRLGGQRRASVDARAGFCSARLGASGVTVAISARAPEGQTVAFQYSDPGGGQHHALNCSIAELHVRVELQGAGARVRDRLSRGLRAGRAGDRPRSFRGAVPRPLMFTPAFTEAGSAVSRAPWRFLHVYVVQKAPGDPRNRHLSPPYPAAVRRGASRRSRSKRGRRPRRRCTGGTRSEQVAVVGERHAGGPQTVGRARRRRDRHDRGIPGREAETGAEAVGEADVVRVDRSTPTSSSSSSAGTWPTHENQAGETSKRRAPRPTDGPPYSRALVGREPPGEKAHALGRRRRPS